MLGHIYATVVGLVLLTHLGCDGTAEGSIVWSDSPPSDETSLANSQSSFALGPIDAIPTTRPLTLVMVEPETPDQLVDHMMFGAQVAGYYFAFDVDSSAAGAAVGMTLPSKTYGEISLTPNGKDTLRAESGSVRIVIEEAHAEIFLNALTFGHPTQPSLGPWTGTIEGKLVRSCRFLADAPSGSAQLADGTRNRVHVDDPDWSSPFCAQRRESRSE